MAMAECVRCKRKEPEDKILSNGLCERCDELLYGKKHPWVYPWPYYPQYHFEWSNTPSNDPWIVITSDNTSMGW